MKPLRVALETQFAYRMPTGIGVYAAGLARALRRRADVEVVEVCNPAADVWRFDKRIWWDQISAPVRARKSAADVFHFTGGTLPVFAPRPCVLTLHDLAWLDAQVPGKFYTRWYFRGLQRKLAGRADRLAADTQWAASQIVERLSVQKGIVAVTGAAVDDIFFSVDRQEPEQRYLLSVGTVEPRKNLVAIVRALSHVPDVRLISVGPPTRYVREVQRAIADANLSARIELRGYVDSAALLGLYSGAAALVYPSRYEGFGLPPLQALAAKVPVIAGDIPVLREVLGDCAVYAGADDIDGLAEAVKRVLAHGPDIRARIDQGRMRARQFTWNAVAERVVRLYHSVA